jgi:hypothetical protein
MTWPNQGVNASNGQVLENGRRVRRRRVTPTFLAMGTLCDDGSQQWVHSRFAQLALPAVSVRNGVGSVVVLQSNDRVS